MPSPNTLPTVCASARRDAVQGRAIHVLVWHDIVPATKLVWFDTTIREFEAQMARLDDAGGRPIALDDLYSYLATGTPAPPPGACVLCFDDNTVGIYDHAFPLLTSRGWPFAVSAHTKYVGVRTGKSHCTYDQLAEMERGGAVRVVSQTHTHPPDLRRLPPPALRRDLWESKVRLEDALGHTVRFVTYPSGKWDNRVAVAARDAGYRMALTEDHGASQTSPHLLGLHRWSTHRRWGEALAAVARAAKG